MVKNQGLEGHLMLFYEEGTRKVWKQSMANKANWSLKKKSEISRQIHETVDICVKKLFKTPDALI